MRLRSSGAAANGAEPRGPQAFSEKKRDTIVVFYAYAYSSIRTHIQILPLHSCNLYVYICAPLSLYA